MKKSGIPDVDPDVIRRASQGDATAFTSIYEQTKNQAYGIALRMHHGNEADAEESTQDAYLQLFRKIQTFRGESKFTTWFHRLVVNVVLMKFRRKKVNIMPIDELAPPHEDGSPRQEPAALARSDDYLESMPLRDNTWQLIDKLPLGYKTMLVLHDLEGYEHNEIAKITGTSIGNSKSQLQKARVRLKRLSLEIRGFRTDPRWSNDELENEFLEFASSSLAR